MSDEGFCMDEGCPHYGTTHYCHDHIETGEEFNHRMRGPRFRDAAALLILGAEPETHLRTGLADTPKRVAKAWEHWMRGYKMNESDLFTTFADGAENVDQLVIQTDIPFWSFCEHHLAPFFGVVSIGYIPDGHVLGLSKMNRLVEMYACRLQIQERLTTQIADAMERNLTPQGVGVLIRARHTCIESRGIAHRGCSTTTSALRGALIDAEARAEFMRLALTSTPL